VKNAYDGKVTCSPATPSSDNLVVNRWNAHPNELAHRLAAQALEGFLDEERGPTAGAGSLRIHPAHRGPPMVRCLLDLARHRREWTQVFGW